MLEFKKVSRPKIQIESHPFRVESWGCPRDGVEGEIEADQTSQNSLWREGGRGNPRQAKGRQGLGMQYPGDGK